METLSLVINATPNHEGVLENVRTNCSFLLSNRSIEGFLFDSLIGRFPAGSKIYVFGRLIKSVKLVIIPFNTTLHDYSFLPNYGMRTTF